MKILLANPRGFCAGVDRAISVVEKALEYYGAPVYVRHEVVHNRYVVEALKEKGAVFVENLSSVPEGAILIFSAHGVSLAIREEAQKRHLRVFDATCPLVTKVHNQVARASRNSIETILIGHAGHIEVEGTMGQYTNPEGAIYLVEDVEDVKNLVVKKPDQLNFVTQTTLSLDDTAQVVDELNQRFPDIVRTHKNDICYATTNRQKAVRLLAEQSDIVLVVGSKNSSNSNRLAELASRMGKVSYLIDFADDIKKEWFTNDVKIVGVTAGASAPEILVQQVIDRLKTLGGESVAEIESEKEEIMFELPKSLKPHVSKS